MSRTGRRPVATQAQADEVRRLAAEGASKRKIAGTVFGDARYHGRVERILRPIDPGTAASGAGDRAPTNEVSADGQTVPLIRELLNRHRERLATDDLPSLKDIELLMKLERQLDAADMVERANALTRES